MSQRRIPPKLRDTVVMLSAEGLISDLIAEKLNKEHGIDVSGRAVRRLLQEHRDELADVAKGVARDELRKHLLLCVKVIVGVAARASEIEKTARGVPVEGQPAPKPSAKDLGVALKAQDRQIRAATTLLHFAGLGQPDHPDDSTNEPTGPARKDELLQRLERLIGAETQPARGPDDEPKVH